MKPGVLDVRGALLHAFNFTKDTWWPQRFSHFKFSFPASTGWLLSTLQCRGVHNQPLHDESVFCPIAQRLKSSSYIALKRGQCLSILSGPSRHTLRLFAGAQWPSAPGRRCSSGTGLEWKLQQWSFYSVHRVIEKTIIICGWHRLL